MKIGIYTPYLDTMTGGELYMLSMAEFLSKEHVVDIFWDDSKILEKAKKRFNLHLKDVRIVENIFSSKYSTFFRFRKTFQYDRIIYLSDGSLPLLAPKKLIVHFQQPIKSNDVSRFQILRAKNIRKIICNSLYTKSFIDRVYKVDSEILYPPVQKIQTVAKSKKNIILTVGRFYPYKNNSDYKKIGFMIDAFRVIKRKYPNWEFHVVVSVKDEHEKEFNEHIVKKAKDIVIIKNADYGTVQKEYGEAKIYWHASGFGENIEKYPDRAEHFGISTVEAMSAGCVPIVVGLGGQREIITTGKNGYLWDTEEELVQYTLDVIYDEKELDKLSYNAQKITQRFNKEKFCKRLQEIIA